MVRKRTRAYLDRVVAELRRSFAGEYTPHQIAGSFAVGVFITMLPTLGLGLLVMGALVYLFDSINKVALFGSILVLNPVVKWGVYAASIALGIVLLGPVEGIAAADVTAETGRAMLVRLWVGNTILAIIATAIAYPTVYRLSSAYQAPAQDVVEAVLEELEEDGVGVET